VVLVTHKATPKLNTRHKTLRDLLAQKAGDNAPHQISVRVHKKKPMNREYTQRSRSFLFVSIGATIAKMLGLSSVRFYENGGDQPEPPGVRSSRRRSRHPDDAPQGDEGLPGHHHAGGRSAIHGRKPVHLEDQGPKSSNRSSR
jgi:hypothetical protein